MSKYVKIITDDSRFAKMLSLELASIGIKPLNDVNSLDDSDRLFIVADLDNVSTEELRIYDSSVTVIGFSKNDIQNIDVCSLVFKRPFLMSDFLSVFGEGEAIKVYNSKSKNFDSIKKPQILTVDENSNTALWGDLKISLSEYEYKVLSLLCENRGEVVERERIYSLLGAEDGNMGDVYICHLRRKIDNKLGLKLIYTIRGKGYMLKN